MSNFFRCVQAAEQHQGYLTVLPHRSMRLTKPRPVLPHGHLIAHHYYYLCIFFNIHPLLSTAPSHRAFCQMHGLSSYCSFQATHHVTSRECVEYVRCQSSNDDI